MVIHTKTCSKLTLWSIWLSGMAVIALSLYFNTTPGSESLGDFLFATIFSSIPFAVLAICTKQTCENKLIDANRKKTQYFGITGAYIATVLFAIWSFSASMDDALNPAGFFWILSIGSIFIGATVGIGIYKVVTIFENRN